MCGRARTACDIIGPDMDSYHPIKDRFGRTVEYLRISVTDFCNQRCRYCMPPEGVSPLDHNEILRFEEIRDIVRHAVSFGICKIRLTGGEPLVRKGITDLVQMIGDVVGIETLAMSTNGTLLADWADQLHAAGLDRVNIGIDSLRPDVFERITRRDLCERAVTGIKAAQRAGLDPVKINVVVMRGVNDIEIPDFVQFAETHDIEVRFIEYMPHRRDIGDGDRLFVAGSEILERVRGCGHISHTDSPERSGPAEMYVMDRTGVRIGVIRSVSRPPCAMCNRLRLRADGQLVACLYDGGTVDLRTLVRSNATRETIRAAFEQAANLKPRVHSLARATIMSRLGG